MKENTMRGFECAVDSSSVIFQCIHQVTPTDAASASAVASAVASAAVSASASPGGVWKGLGEVGGSLMAMRDTEITRLRRAYVRSELSREEMRRCLRTLALQLRCALGRVGRLGGGGRRGEGKEKRKGGERRASNPYCSTPSLKKKLVCF